MECQIDMADRMSDGMNCMPWCGSLEAKYFFLGEAVIPSLNMIHPTTGLASASN